MYVSNFAVARYFPPMYVPAILLQPIGIGEAGLLSLLDYFVNVMSLSCMEIAEVHTRIGGTISNILGIL